MNLENCNLNIWCVLLSLMFLQSEVFKSQSFLLHNRFFLASPTLGIDREIAYSTRVHFQIQELNRFFHVFTPCLPIQRISRYPQQLIMHTHPSSRRLKSPFVVIFINLVNLLALMPLTQKIKRIKRKRKKRKRKKRGHHIED